MSRCFPRIIMALALCPAVAIAQKAPDPPTRADTVTVAAGPEYHAGGLHTFLFGKGYRELWTTPFRVPVLDLQSYDGGLKPEKLGGGMQTLSLHLKGKEGGEYVFRTVNKRVHVPGKALRGALVEDFFRDQISASHPAAALVVAPLLDAAGVLHATPTLYVMPRDSVLGKFDTLFAGRLGLVEQYTGKKKHRETFDDAAEIVDSDSLLKLLNRDPREQVDQRANLAARLMDMLIGDIDRHPGNWKWARLEKGRSHPWVAVPRDRDQAFISYSGALVAIARLAAPNLERFDGNYSVAGLTHNSLQLDSRLLVGLEKPVWDSVASDLMKRITNAVIDSAVLMMPKEYHGSAPALAATLKTRRDRLPAAAATFYRLLSKVVDIHATDDADRLTVNRLDDQHTELRLESGKEPPYFLRRFDVTETQEVRVYLHGGADTVRVTGTARRGVKVRVIGTKNTTWLTDASSTARRNERPETAGVDFTMAADDLGYGPDSLFDRRPWPNEHGEMVPPGPDHGTRYEPTAGLSADRGLGVTPSAGINRVAYGFGERPYASRLGVDAAFATALPGVRVTLTADKRFAGSPVHLAAIARTSQFDVLEYHGLGNATPEASTDFFDVQRRQWHLSGGPVLALGPATDLSLGPVIEYSVTDSVANRFISGARPYGFGKFGQAGLQLELLHAISGAGEHTALRFKFDVTGAAFPAVWDVKKPYQKISVRTGASYVFPVATGPTLVVRGGGEKLYGDFPFDQAAFLGGNHTLRQFEPERYAGDASLFGNTELRIPLSAFDVIVPLQAGILGTAEAGRVYVGSSSPGGWHTATSGGIFIGRADQSFLVSCTYTHEEVRHGVHCQTGLSF